MSSHFLQNPAASRLGSVGHLVIFIWAVLLVVMTAMKATFLPAALGLVVLGALHPASLKRLLDLRMLVLLGLLFFMNLFFGGGEVDGALFGIRLSTANLLSGLQMVLCAALILLASANLAASVDISEVAGLLERLGMRGLGFSVGVATNLLPDLYRSSGNAWNSLRMRGGLRARWLRGLQLLFITVLANAIRHSEEIVLAAESRAYDPARSRAMPIKVGRLDRWLIPLGALSVTALFILA